MSLATTASQMGGNVLVRLEDSLFIGRGKLAESNAQQVTKIRRIVEKLGCQVASPKMRKFNRDCLAQNALSRVDYRGYSIFDQERRADFLGSAHRTAPARPVYDRAFQRHTDGRAVWTNGSQRGCDVATWLAHQESEKNPLRQRIQYVRESGATAYASARFMVAAHIGKPGVVVRGIPWPSAARFGSPSM